MSNYNYYTPTELAMELLHLIPKDSPITNIADICCGTWNLLNAAHSFFPNASIVGVDTDVSSINFGIQNAKFYALDGRDFANKMYADGVYFDLLLSNPPFGLISTDQKKFDGTENVLLQSRRYESELLYANYKLLKDNGYLLIILPITYVRGTQYKKHRMWIASNFDVLHVVMLPSYTFGTRPLNTVALFLRKSTEHSPYMAQLLSAALINHTWMLRKDSTISYENIISGDWFPGSQIINTELSVFRGSISSSYFTENGTPLLHCSNNLTAGVWIPSVKYCKKIKTTQKKFAEPGDVIINRIGKCAAAWTTYTGKKCLISDCIIVIKKPNETTIEKLNRFSIAGKLQIPRLGVATPYITANDVISLLAQP